MSQDAGWIVGIDLGTTHTVVALTDPRAGETPRVFRIPQLVSTGEVDALPLLPTALYAPLPGEVPLDPWGDAPWVIGHFARERGQRAAGRLVASPKSWLGHHAVDRKAPILPWGSEDPEIPRLSPVEALGRVLAHVRRTFDAAFPEHPLAEQQIVLTVPASFDQVARELTLEAARQADLAVRLLEEPQAAFYDYVQQAGLGALERLVGDHGAALALVCDVGGGTTDLTLVEARPGSDGELDLRRVAVGQHLLLGGDNMDLALAHRCEAQLGAGKLDAGRFAQLVAACRGAKERLLGDAAPDAVRLTVTGTGSSLVGSALSTELTREAVERVVLDGFFPETGHDARPKRARSGLVAFGLPYEPEPAITRHVAAFIRRHAGERPLPQALLLNGGLFRSRRIAERLAAVIGSWGGGPPAELGESHPELAVARGAVAYGLALLGRGIRIGGGAARGYYVGLGADAGRQQRALCVVPRGAREGERHVAASRSLALVTGQPVRFDLYASDSALHAPGAVVTLDEETYQQLPPVVTSFETEEGADGDSPARAEAQQIRVKLEGELSAIGTLDLACVEEQAEAAAPAGSAPRRFRLAFDLRSAPKPAPAPERSPRSRGGAAFAQAEEALLRVFGKGRKDVRTREVKDLLRELERLLGERACWDTEINRALCDHLLADPKARRRSLDHERVFWMLAGFCLRPGFGDPGDARRIRVLAPRFDEGLFFPGEARGWQQFWIAWRRVAGGLEDAAQVRIRDRVDLFLSTEQQPRGKKKKAFNPQAYDEMLAMASTLERVGPDRRTALGSWILERTWTSRDPRLWAAIGRIGARVPTYASVHHVVPPRTAERWLDHLLREKWEEMPSATRAARDLARLTGDRARDVSDSVREAVARRLEQQGADAEWIRAVRELVPVEEQDRAEFFGEGLPVGLRLLD